MSDDLRDIEHFSFLCVLADMSRHVTRAHVEFIVSGGDPRGCRLVLEDLVRHVHRALALIPGEETSDAE